MIGKKAEVQIIGCCVLLIITCACKNSLQQQALERSVRVREQISRNADQDFSSKRSFRFTDSTSSLSFEKRGDLLKNIILNFKTGDTVAVFSFGPKMKLANVKLFCSYSRDSGELFTAKDSVKMGLHEIFYCNGRLRRKGLEYGGPVGIWEEFDTGGSLIKKTDYGQPEKLKLLSHLSTGE